MFGFFKKKKDGLTAMSAVKLLAPYEQMIDAIHLQVGVPHWEVIYLDFIRNFAEQVQLLPASESHHHSGAGGLLTHSLEVGLNALKIRKDKMLPVGGSAEVIEEQKELWSYAVFTAAMLHDIGKPLTDQIITIVSDKNRKWNPLTETIPLKSLYRIEFNRQRKYRSHENVALLLAPKIVPAPGMDWLTSNSEVLDDWTFCLTGRKAEANTLGELVTHADQISTSQNLTGSNNVPLPTAKSIPLHTRLKTALIYLLDDATAIPLNRVGAAGWAYDGKLWLVSKRVLDELKKHMIEEGQTGIPSDNTRLMDELMQNNIIVETDDNKAIHKMSVQIKDDKQNWKNDFTLLCFPMNKLWPDVTAWPSQPDSITVLRVDTKTDNKNSTEEKKPEASSPSKRKSDTESIATVSESTQETKKETPPILDLPLPPGINIDKKINKKTTPKKPRPEPELTVEAISKTPPKQIEADSTPANLDYEKKPEKPKKDYGQQFIDWVSSGIADGSMPINMQNALVHTLGDKKDLLLVSPSIFRSFSKLHNTTYSQVQRDFQILNLHTTTSSNQNVWKFNTIRKRRGRPANTLNGMLIEDAENKLKIRLPPGNTNIDYSRDTTD